MYRAVKFTQMYASDGTSLTALHSDRAQFLNHVSPIGSAAELKSIAREHGWEFHRKSVRVTGRSDGSDMPRTVRVIELVEREAVRNWDRNKTQPVYLAWIKVPEIDELPLRPVISDEVSETEMEAMRYRGCDEDLGVGQWGSDESGEPVIAVSSHAFYAIGPALGYSVAAMCALYGGTEDSLTWDDQVFSCCGCDALQQDSDGYEYRFRWVDDCMYGTECGCAGEAELKHLEEFINVADKQLLPETAEQLVEAGHLEQVSQHVYQHAVLGQGGYFDDGDPKQVLPLLLEREPGAKFVLAMDEASQFRVYWSIYRVVSDELTRTAKSAAE